MRISDWSSDVCSSDLRNAVPPPGIGTPGFSTAPVTTRSLPASHRHRCLDRRQRVVAFDGDVVVAETEDVAHVGVQLQRRQRTRSEEHTSELQSLMRISYAVFCLKKKTPNKHSTPSQRQ